MAAADARLDGRVVRPGVAREVNVTPPAEDEDEEEGSDERNSDDDDGADSGEEEELDPKDHPLLRPGAMPRMSKAAMEMSIKMMTQDIVGEVDEDEEDELEDD